MSTPYSANVYTQGFGSKPELGSIIAQVNPGTIWSPSWHIGQEWINTLANTVYVLTSLVTSAGVTTPTWTLLESGSSSFLSLTGDSGGAILPSAGNVNLRGGSLDNFVGSGSTLTLTPTAGAYPISPFVVGPVGKAGYQTIQSAINAANAAGGGTVYIQTGTYTENLTFFANVQLQSAVAYEDSGSVQITGIHTPPTTGNIAIRGIQMNSATHIFSSAAAGSGRISFLECTFNVTNGYVYNLINWTGTFNINDCGSIGVNDGVVNNTGGANIFFNNCQVGAGTTNPMITNGVSIRLDLTFVVPPINISGSGLTLGLLTVFGNTLTVSGTATVALFLGDFLDSGNSAIVNNSSNAVVLNTVTIASSAATVIAGTGTVQYVIVGFSNNSTVAGGTTISRAGEFDTGIIKSGAVTAVTGSITATNGNLVLGTAGNKIISTSVASTTSAGANSFGTVTLVGGTATVSTTAVTANSIIILTRQSIGSTGAAALGQLTIGTVSAGTSFVINAALTATATSLATTDVSVIGWMIIN